MACQYMINSMRKNTMIQNSNTDTLFSRLMIHIQSFSMGTMETAISLRLHSSIMSLKECTHLMRKATSTKLTSTITH